LQAALQAAAASDQIPSTTEGLLPARSGQAQAGDECYNLTVGTLCSDTHPGAYSGQDAYTGRLVPVADDAGQVVRRLTVREVERLQGFPDDWTQIPWRGKPADQCPDGPRYKACGNSMAVPVIRWLAQRIEATR